MFATLGKQPVRDDRFALAATNAGGGDYRMEGRHGEALPSGMQLPGIVGRVDIALGPLLLG